MGVLIDPYMFELSDEKEIENNISFFREIIKLCTQSGQMPKLQIIFYKGLFEKISQRSIQPFPITLKAISDVDLRGMIMQVNASFSRVLLEAIHVVDIDECSGEQNFETDDKGLSEDRIYYEMLCTLLIPCYLRQIDIDDRILTGKKNGRQIGSNFQIQCSCSGKRYIKDCRFVGIDEFVSTKEKIIRSLREKRIGGKIPITEEIRAVMGDHHNHVQADRKKFDSLNELSVKNKIVLKLLQQLGLFKIIFARFDSKGVRAVGTMRIYDVEQHDTQDIVVVKFNAETEMQFMTDLYFPKGIGQLLCDYFQKEQLTYRNVNELVERIK